VPVVTPDSVLAASGLERSAGVSVAVSVPDEAVVEVGDEVLSGGGPAGRCCGAPAFFARAGVAEICLQRRSQRSRKPLLLSGTESGTGSVASHEGSLSVSSSPGTRSGVTFKVVLPKLLAPRPSAAERRPKRGCRISRLSQLLQQLECPGKIQSLYGAVQFELLL
jgi:hypothetical protein